jgi:hypothetical protein
LIVKSTEEPKRSKLYQIIKYMLQSRKLPNKCKTNAYEVGRGSTNIFRDRPDFAGQQDVGKSYIQEQKTTST